MEIKISGPGGKTVTLRPQADMTKDEILAKVNDVQTNWGMYTGLEGTAPEQAPDYVAGPLRPTAADAAAMLQPTEGQDAASFAQKERARGLQDAMTPEQRDKAVTAVAQREAQDQLATLGPRSAPLYGASGTLAPHVIDKGIAGANAALYYADKGQDALLGQGKLGIGQPYGEGIRTERALRDENWKNNKLATMLGGAATVGSIPIKNFFNPTTVAGWTGNAAANAGAYGALHGAGEGEGLGQAIEGAVKEGGISTLGGGVVGRLTARARPQSLAEIAKIKDAATGGMQSIPQAVASDSDQVAQNAGLLSKFPILGSRLNKALNRTIADVGENIHAKSAQIAGRDVDKMPTDYEVGQRGAGAINNWMRRLLPQRQAEREAAILDDLVTPGAYSPLENTRRAATALTRLDEQNATRIGGEAIEAVSDALGRNQGMTFQGMRGLRTAVQNARAQNKLEKGGTLDQAYTTLMRGLTKDIEAHVARYGKRGAASLRDFRRTMRHESIDLGKREQLLKLVGKGKGDELEPEKLITEMHNWAASKTASVAKMRRLKSIVPREVFDDLVANLMHRAGRQGGKREEFALATWEKFWKNASPEIKREMLDGHPQALEALNALSRTIDNIQRVTGEINFSRTAYAMQLNSFIERSARAVGNAIKGIGGVLTGTGVGAGAGAAGLGGVVTSAVGGGVTVGFPILYGRWLARMWSNPARIRTVTALMRNATKLDHGKGPKLQQFIAAQSKLLNSVATEIANDEEAKKAGLTQQQIAAELHRELLPQRN